MSHLNKLFFLFILCIGLTASCGKSDVPEEKKQIVQESKEEEGTQEPEGETNQEEETVSTTMSNTIANNVLIKGSTKVEGSPPTPNGAITLDLSNAHSSAVVNEGFNIPIISNAEVTGAYIQFKAIDEGVSESYFDVDLMANIEENNSSAKKTTSQKRLKEVIAKKATAKMVDEVLDIDFGSAIAPGEFCYVICVYDAQGNISNPQEVCVNVNAWGGNAALVGTWNAIKYVDEENGEVDIDFVGEEYCWETGCSTEEVYSFTFNADTTFEVRDRYINRKIDEAYSNDYEEYVYRGNWSYPEGENSELILVDYYYSESTPDNFIEEFYEEGEADVFVIKADGIILMGNELQLVVDEEDDDGDGIVDYKSTLVLEKE